MNWLSQIFGAFRAFQFIVVIAPWESALRVRMGKVAKILVPGAHLRLPFIDRIFIQASRLRTISDSGQTITTKDGKVLTLSVAVSYAISNIERLYSSVSNPESTLLWSVQGLIAEAVSNSNSTSISPDSLETLVMGKIPSEEWGLSGVRVMVTDFAFVRVYRLMNYAQRYVSNANELETRTNPTL